MKSTEFGHLSTVLDDVMIEHIAMRLGTVHHQADIMLWIWGENARQRIFRWRLLEDYYLLSIQIFTIVIQKGTIKYLNIYKCIAENISYETMESSLNAFLKEHTYPNVWNVTMNVTTNKSRIVHYSNSRFYFLQIF